MTTLITLQGHNAVNNLATYAGATTRQIAHEMYIIFHRTFIDYSYCSCMNFLQFHKLNIFHKNFIQYSWQKPSMKHP